jgi:hypothetical protein
MANKTLLELARDIGIEKRALENKVYYLKRKGTELGTLIDNVRYFSSDEQEQLKQHFEEKKAQTESSGESTDLVLYLKEEVNSLKIEKSILKQALEKVRDKSEQEASELRQLIAQSNANLNKALEKNERLQLDYEELKQHKGFFARLFGG